MDNEIDSIIAGTAGTGKSKFFAINEDKNPFVVLDKDREDIDKTKEKFTVNAI